MDTRMKLSRCKCGVIHVTKEEGSYYHCRNCNCTYDTRPGAIIVPEDFITEHWKKYLKENGHILDIQIPGDEDIQNLNKNTPDCIWHQDKDKKLLYNKRLCYYGGRPSTGCQINIDTGMCKGGVVLQEKQVIPADEHIADELSNPDFLEIAIAD